MSDFLVIEKVSKHFGPLRAVDEVTLEIGQKEIFSLLGPSGCGKTTLLKMLGGFEKPERGRLLLAGKDITALPPEKRPVNTVFQNYALFPHLTVAENIAFGLKIAKRPADEIRRKVGAMLDLVRLTEHERKKPALLSGGQKQRVAIARALVNEPQVLLLDEPLAALDLKLRQHLLAELQAIHTQVGTTFIYVTHDQGEALSVSHRIAVMDSGRVAQVDTPRGLYERPVNRFVAGFIGDANFIAATADLTNDTATKNPAGFLSLHVPQAGGARLLVTAEGGPPAPGQEVQIMVRPERLHLCPEKGGDETGQNWLPVIVETVTYFGTHARVSLRCGTLKLHAQVPAQNATAQPLPHPGQSAWASFAPESARLVG